MVAQKKSPTKLNAVIFFMNGENHQGKTPPGEFKVTTLKNPLLLKQDITSKKNPST